MSAPPVILHIGVHKTGSTALQAALAQARTDLARAGILYPGTTVAHHAAARALMGRSFGFGDEAWTSSPRAWKSLVRSTRRHSGTVIISSEFFDRMRPRDIRVLVDALGTDRLHVLFAVRPLGDLLPSSWQQYLKSGLTLPYSDWLDQVLHSRKPRVTPGFWSRVDFAALVHRWRAVLPRQRITAVVLDPTDRDLLFRTTEELVGLPPGWLAPYRVAGTTNRSMTAPEAELLRQVNLLMRDNIGWNQYQDRVRRGAIGTIVANRTPPADEPALATPEWAVRIAVKRQRRDFRRLTRSGIDLRGDPGILLKPREGSDTPALDSLPLDLAALGVAGAAGYAPG